MSRVLSNPNCPFDWEGEENRRLQGGYLLAVTAHRFAYVYANPGSMRRVLITGKRHGEDDQSLLWDYPREMAELYAAAKDVMYGSPLTVYINVGKDAGETVFGHAHLHILGRDPYDPARGKGVGKLIADHNTLYRQTEWMSGT